MSLDLTKISPHLQSVLLELKHMSMYRRFAEVSKPRYELNWATIASAYGMEKLEKQKWVIPDDELLGIIHHGDNHPNTRNPGACLGTPDTEARRTAGAGVCVGDDATDERQVGVVGKVEGEASSTRQMTTSAPIPTSGLQTSGLQPGVTALAATGSTLGVGGDIPVPGTIAHVAQKASTEPESKVSREQKRPALPPMSEEDTKKLYTGENREYRDTEPQYDQERRESIERAAQISAGRTQFNGHWEVLTDAEAQELDTDIEDVPYDDNYVLARDGRVMHRIELQYSVEKDIRDKLGVPEPWRPDEQKIAWYRRQIALLEKADAAPRCGHIYADGTGCRAPKLKDGKWCYAHTRMKQVRAKRLRLGPMEDANAVMLNLMEIGRALCDDEISEKRAGLLLYQQQLGLIAMKGLTFKETDPDLMTVQAPEEPAGDERRRAKKVGRELTRRNTNREKRVSHKATRKRADQGKERSVSGSNAGIARRKAGFNDSPTPGLNRVNPMNSGLNGEGHGGLPKMPKLPKSDDCFEN